MGRQASTPPSEIQIRTDWGNLFLDPKTPPCGPAYKPSPDKFPEVIQVDGLFSEDECKQLIEAAEDYGFGTTGYEHEYRGNLRLTAFDTSLADAIWKRLQQLMPPVVTTDDRDPNTVWKAVGLNECWRIAKYRPGDKFETHVDACFRRSTTERSMFTVNIYMNGDFEGGSTRFYACRASPPAFAVEPVPGRCCIFRQPPGAKYLHDGEAVRAGFKYLFRTDVIYSSSGSKEKTGRKTRG